MTLPSVGSTGRGGAEIPLQVSHTLVDVQDQVHEIGEPVTVKFRLETDVARDKYGSVKGRPTASKTFTVYVFPHDTNPNERKLQVAGLSEASDALIWTPTKDWLDNGVDFFDIDVERTTFVFEEISYRIVEKGRASELGGIHRYFTFSIKRI